MSPDGPAWRQEVLSSLTLGRVRQSALRARAGASDCDKVCHLTQIPRGLCLACRHCSGRVCPAVSCTVRESQLHVVHDQTLQAARRNGAQTSCTATANHGRDRRDNVFADRGLLDVDPCRLSSNLTNWTLSSRRQPHCSLAIKLEDSGKPARLTGASPTGSLRNQTNHVSFRLHAIPGTTCPELCGSSMPPMPPPVPGNRRFCRRILVVR